MESRAKFRFPRAFFSTLTSCRTQNLLSDVIHNHHSQKTNPLFSASSLDPPPSSPVRRSSSSCKPRCPHTFDQMVRNSCLLPGERKKLCGGHALFPTDDIPLSPLSPLPKQSNKKNARWRRTRFIKERSDSSGEDWFSSDDEREDNDVGGETETLFSSSRSFLSLSSDPDSTGSARGRRRPPSARRREARRREKVKGSFAVVKRSRDPYSDFRKSMVEMIMEKQIFGAKDLQHLLECFLSLNPANHHCVIFEVFAEICDALFSDFC